MKNKTYTQSAKPGYVKYIFGGVFLLLGIATITKIAGIVFIALSILFFTYSSGSEIDFKNSKLREYTRILFLTFGKWHHLNEFKRLLIKRERRGTRIYGGRTMNSVGIYDTYFCLYIVPEKYFNKISILVSKEQHEVEEFASKMSNDFNLAIETIGAN